MEFQTKVKFRYTFHGKMDFMISFAGSLRCMGELPCFSTIFTKADNFYDFLFVVLDYEGILKLGLLLNKRICSYRSKFFSLGVDAN